MVLVCACVSVNRTERSPIALIDIFEKQTRPSFFSLFPEANKRV